MVSTIRHIQDMTPRAHTRSVRRVVQSTMTMNGYIRGGAAACRLTRACHVGWNVEDTPWIVG
jgi:hypothetical protein